MIVSSYHYLVAPLIACGALLVIILMCRWVFAPPPKRTPVASAAARGGDFGLLVPVATARTPDDAAMLQAVLKDAGIRCTVAGASVLVFRADAQRAQALVSS